MSLGQLSSRGKQNNKLYQIFVEISLNNDNVIISFYSTRRIDTFLKLRDFLLTCNNQLLKVSSDSFLNQSDKFYLVSQIKYAFTNSIQINYHVNDGQGWRIGYFNRGTFFISEV